jgi:glyoxylase-like metal-dependent hydrolase (beta-lactamase superfamily II)
MDIKTIKIKWAENELSQNTHVVEFENSCIVVDAGCPVKKIKEIINKRIKAVFLTHGHFDHIKNIEEYDKLNIQIYASKNINELLNDEIKNEVVTIDDIEKTIIYTKDNKQIIIENGYLELGVIDTMKDLFVNFIGAVVFSIFGYLYVINREKYKGLEKIIPQVKRD